MSIQELGTQSQVEVEMITCVIDGFEITVPKGTLVIRAAEKLGIQIPRFCDHPLLAPAGACRQCLVDIEINGRAFPKPQASCTIPVENGMIVKTQLTSPVADKAQKGIMELLLINHPLTTQSERPIRAAVLIISADRGMAGAYSNNAIKEGEQLAALLKTRGLEVKSYLVGRKAVNYYSNGVTASVLWDPVLAPELWDRLREDRAVIDEVTPSPSPSATEAAKVEIIDKFKTRTAADNICR